jgi:hypothetical protein
MRHMTVATPVRRPHDRNCVLVLAATSGPQDAVSTHLESGFVMNPCIEDIPSALFLGHTLTIRCDVVRTVEFLHKNSIYVDWTLSCITKQA